MYIFIVILTMPKLSVTISQTGKYRHLTVHVFGSEILRNFSEPEKNTVIIIIQTLSQTVWP